jgi:hypothetical protein
MFEQHWSTIDATRLSDGKRVTLKKVEQSDHPNEVELALFLSSTSDPRNHTVPIYEVLSRQDESDFQILVMPRLRELKSPPFETCGELVECFRQLIEVRLFITKLPIVNFSWQIAGIAIYAYSKCGTWVTFIELAPNLH